MNQKQDKCRWKRKIYEFTKIVCYKIKNIESKRNKTSEKESNDNNKARHGCSACRHKLNGLFIKRENRMETQPHDIMAMSSYSSRCGWAHCCTGWKCRCQMKNEYDHMTSSWCHHYSSRCGWAHRCTGWKCRCRCLTVQSGYALQDMPTKLSLLSWTGKWREGGGGISHSWMTENWNRSHVSYFLSQSQEKQINIKHQGSNIWELFTAAGIRSATEAI